jgi:toxin ParE1/3/4
VPSRQWQIRLTQTAERDFADIIAWTANEFGERQARRYAEAIARAIAALASGPKLLGSRTHDDLPAGLRILPVARRGMNARHVLLYRSQGDEVIEVIRILHQAMDLPRHATKE